MMLFDEDTWREAKGHMSREGQRGLEMECRATGLSEVEVMRRRVVARLSQAPSPAEPVRYSLANNLKLAVDNTKP